jgi:hypothetical protein
MNMKPTSPLLVNNQSKNHDAGANASAGSNNDRDCRVVTPLVGHWYLEYQQYGGGFIPCEGIVQ